MRNWINLSEASFSEKPSFTLAVTDELVNEIIQSGKWVDHGGELADWWNEMDQYNYVGDRNAEDYLGGSDAAVALLAKPWKEVAGLPQVKNLVTAALLSSAQYYDDNLVIHGETTLYRGLVLPDGETFDPKKPIGRFWSTDRAQAYRFMDNSSVGKNSVFLTASIKNCDVDWRETIRSRLDQFHGDEEEIQLTASTPIVFTAQACVEQAMGPPKPVKTLGTFRGTV